MILFLLLLREKETFCYEDWISVLPLWIPVLSEIDLTSVQVDWNDFFRSQCLLEHLTAVEKTWQREIEEKKYLGGKSTRDFFFVRQVEKYDTVA